jgi:flagellar biosynthetic protein FlhB
VAEAGYEEKTEPATPRRREEARKEGQVARSADLSTALSIVGALIALTALGPGLVGSLKQLIVSVYGRSASLELDGFVLQRLLAGWVAPVMASFLLFAVAVAGVGVLSSVVQFGFMLVPKNLSPRWERIDPLQGFSRLFSWASAGAFVAGLLKLLAVGGIAWLFVKAQMPSFPQHSRLHETEMLGYTGGLITGLGWRIAGAMLVIGLADYLFQRWRYERELRMSKQEIKDEFKQQEGDPAIKQRIRQIQRQRAMQRMMEDVPKATVVITNPTHFAVALRYEMGMRAPRVVAKGQNLIAQRIRGLAEQHGVPIEENPPLARGLYRATQVGQELPPEFYRAIAQVMAVLMHRRHAQAARRLQVDPGGIR